MANLHDIIILDRDVYSDNDDSTLIEKGSLGTVVHVFEKVADTYDVEFSDGVIVTMTSNYFTIKQ